MRPDLFDAVLPFARALEIVLEAAGPIARTETVDLIDADGRVAAKAAIAPGDVPQFDRAAMDGYAVVASDLQNASADNARVLTRVGGLFSGDVPNAGIQTGECIEIATGAPIPPGTTAVVMVEETTARGDVVEVRAAARPGQNIGRRASDITQGQPVVAAGDLLTPGRIGSLAAIGVASVEVFARPSVAICSTGNEVVPPGGPIAPGQVYDVNRFTMSAVVRRHGGLPYPSPPVGDTIADLHAALDAALEHDVAVFSGGSSVGGRDLMIDLLSARGEVLFHGIGVKPGKPTLFGRVGRTLVFGMPGNPTSCLSNAYMLLLPLVRRMARLPPWAPHTVTVPLARRITSTADRHQFYTVRVVDGHAEPAFKGSGEITSMANADGFIEIPVGITAVEEGASVVVKFF